MADILLSKCAQFREQDEFIDVRLQVGEEVFSAHRMVLAANSDYFHAMFTNGMRESKQEVIALKDESISADALRIVLDSIYGGDLLVNEGKAFDVLDAANHLQITNVVRQCCDYLNTHFLQDGFDLQRYCQLSAVADRHGLRVLQESAERKMASMYNDICDREEFLSQINACQLLSFLSRDDLSAPSETFVFKSVMNWIKHKKEERLPVAAKVIEAVRLGLVDIGVLIEELNTEEFQRVPEIHKILIDASLYFHAPSQISKFAETTKPRAASTVLVAIKPKWSQVQYFDVETKLWKPLPFMAVLPGAESCVCTERVGNNLYVAANDTNGSYVCCYNIDKNSWEKLPHSFGLINSLCKMGDHMYAISSNYQQVPQRYSFAKRQWQSIAKINPTGILTRFLENFSLSGCCYNGAVVCHSKLYVFHGCKYVYNNEHFHSAQRTVVHCFDESRNQWVKKWTTTTGYFGSSAFVVNDKLYISGGRNSPDINGISNGEHSDVRVYDELNGTWSVVDQKHIPPNKLGAVEIEGRVYFIINKFPVDSGIRIPPGEVYPVCLSEWENLGNVSEDAALCYLPFKRGMEK